MDTGRDEKGHFIKGCKVNQGRVPSASQRGKQAAAMTGRVESDEHKEKIRAGLLASEKTIGRPKGGIPWNKGMRIANGDPIPLRPPISDCSRKKYSKAAKKRWADFSPERRRKAIVAMLSASIPNKAEVFLNNLLDEMYPNEWKFVGNGDVIIAGKSPDFININGQKKIIEFYGEHWHQNDDPRDRESVFAPYGYKTLVIWGKEMKNIELLKERICRFYNT